MARHTLYAYIDGSDLHDLAARLEPELDAFVDGRVWSRRTWVVNQRYALAGEEQVDDVPDWDLGLNHDLPDVHAQPADWFGEVEAIAGLLGTLAQSFRRSFVIGIADNVSGLTEDVHDIRDGNVDLPRLRAILGASPPET